MFKLTSDHQTKFSLLIALFVTLLMASNAFAKPSWKDSGSDSDNTKGKGNGKNRTAESHEIVVTTSLSNQSVLEGESIAFSVMADSTDGQTINYQWSFNSQLIEGATSSTYKIDQVSLDAAGEYSVSLSTSYTSLSENALLSVEAIPEPGPDIEIYFQPISQSGYEQDSLTLNVSASGSGTLFYQWRKNGENIPNAIHSYFSLDSLSSADSADYDVVISNATGQVISDSATVTIKQLRSISLSWDAPTLRENGDALLVEEIDSYQIFLAYEHEQPEVINVASSTSSIALNNMKHGTYYLEIATTDTQGITGMSSEQIAIEIN